MSAWWTGLLLAASLDGGTPLPEAAAADTAMTNLLNETLDKLAARHNDEGLRFIRAGDYPAALESFRQAHDFDPEDAEVANNLGFAFFMLGNHERAEYFYRIALKLEPDRYVAHLNLADLLHTPSAPPERLEEAAALLTRARELRGNDPDLILRQARIAVQRGRLDDAERFFREAAQHKPTNDLRIEVGDFYRSQGREEDAVEWYRRVRGDVEAMRRAEDRIRQMEVERQARRFGWTRPDNEISARARNLESRGRLLLRQDRPSEAEEVLRECLSVAPGFSAARVTLGDALRALGRTDSAELEYLRGLALDPGSVDLHARLASLYLAQDDNARAPEAATLLTRALQLRPDRTDLQLPLAKALRLVGDLPGALRAVTSFLEAERPEDSRREAQLLQESLERLLPPGDAVEPERPANTGKGELLHRLNRARAYLARSEADAAMAELQKIPEEDRGVEVRNLEGRILAAAGRHEQAVDAFRQSLLVDDGQAEIHQQVGLLLAMLGQPQDARRHLEIAEALGDVDASYHLARIDAEKSRPGALGWVADAPRLPGLWRARERLERFLASPASSGSIFLEDVRALKDQVDARLWTMAVINALFASLILLLAVSMVRQRWGGADLRTLIAQHPEAGPEVQRLLSAIRHEVLKHNTMVLTGLVDAIGRGEDVAEKATHLQRSLFGQRGEHAVFHRLQGYQEQLEQIGRAHGVRLNLARKDAALSAINEGFRLLRRGGRLLGQGTLRSLRRHRLLRLYRRAARLLNTTGYEAVRGLLDQLRVLRVDEALLREIYGQTTMEPALASVMLEPLSLDVQTELPVGVCIPRSAFEDILHNLLRNALQSSIRSGLLPVGIGLRVTAEVNPITGHERVAFWVCDRSPQKLDLDVLLGQRIEGGLGLTSELASRYDGSLGVETDVEGWQKAVVVKLPREDVTAPGASHA